jgi:hypothetical protein
MSSVAGTFGGMLQGYDGTHFRAYPVTFNIPAANVWTNITIPIPGDIGPFAWGVGNGYGLGLGICLGAGANSQAPANAWATAAAAILTPPGCVSLTNTLNATFYMTGAQIEVGSAATPFELRPYPIELQLCQRYYQASGTLFFGMYTPAGTAINFSYPLLVSMRTTPVVTIDPATGYSNASNFVVQAGSDAAHTNFSLTITNAGYGYTQTDYTAEAEL